MGMFRSNQMFARPVCLVQVCAYSKQVWSGQVLMHCDHEGRQFLIGLSIHAGLANVFYS